MTEMSLLDEFRDPNASRRLNGSERYLPEVPCCRAVSHGAVAMTMEPGVIGGGGSLCTSVVYQRFEKAQAPVGMDHSGPSRCPVLLASTGPAFSKPRVHVLRLANVEERYLCRAIEAWKSEIAASGAKKLNGFGGIATANLARRQVQVIRQERLVAQKN